LDLKGGKMALVVGDNPLVRVTLETVDIAAIIPMFDDADAALDFLRAPQT
jgi:hypothetical protein